MAYLIFKGALTGAIVISIAEIAKRSSAFAAILASLPLTTILALIWLYVDTKDSAQIRQLSLGVFWMVLPSLTFFLELPFFMKVGLGFYPSLVLSCICTAIFYVAFVKGISAFGIQI